MEAHCQEVGHGEEQHHEHKPMMKKVKEKVKRIKQKITKNGHDNEVEHEEPNDYSTEEDYDHEEVQVDPAVDGTHPNFHESAGLKNPVGGQGKVSFGEEMAKTSADQDPSVPKWDQSSFPNPSVTEEQRGKRSHDDVNLGKIEGRVEDDPAAPKVRNDTAAAAVGGQGKVSFGEEMEKTSADQDPSVPKRDQSSLLNPSVTEEQRGKRSPDDVNLGKIEGRVEDDPAAPKVRNDTAAAAADDQFQPSYRSSIERKDNTSPNVDLEDKTGRVEEDPVRGATAEHSTPPYPSPTGGGGGSRDDVGESPILTSFKDMAISDEPKSTPATVTGTEENQHHDQPMQESGQQQKTSSYTDKLSSTATAVKDAAISAAHTVYDTVSGVGSKGSTEGEGVHGENLGKTDKDVSMKEYIVGKLRPGEEDRALSEVLLDTVHTKKQEAVVVVGQGVGDGSAVKGVVDKIKGTVGSWIGAGGTPADAAGAHVSGGTGTEISGGEKDGREDASSQGRM